MVVAKVGTSSVTDATGAIDPLKVDKLARDVAELRSTGTAVVVVTSGAIAAGLPRLGFGERRPRDIAVLQAVSAVGQGHLIGEWYRALSAVGLIGGQQMGDQSGQPVVVAEADLVVGDGVVLVHDRHHPEL